MKISNNSIRYFISALLLGVVVFLWHFKTEPFYKFSLLLNDFKYSFNDKKPTSEVLFLAIDEKSVTQFGRWPWDREFLAQKIKKLASAKAVAFDMVFSEPTSEEKDLTLGQSIGNIDNAICGVFLRNDSTKIFTQEDEETLRESALNRVFVKQLPFLKFRSAEVNIEQIAQNCVFNGIFSAVSDSDSLFRNYPVGFLYDNFVYPSLGIQTLRYTLNKDITIEQIENDFDIQLNKKNITIDKNGFTKLNYYHLQDYKTISFADFVKDNFDISSIKNKIVIFGISEAGVSDIRATPLGQIPGPLLHYTFISNYLQDMLLYSNDYLELALIFLFAFIPIFLHDLVKNTNLRIILYAFTAITIIFTNVVAYKYQIWIDMFYTLFGYTVLLLFNALFIYKTKELETQFMKNAFKNYMSENLLDQLIENPKQLKLGGEKRDVTIIFTDIRGFTTLSESVSSEDLIQILELYFTPMTQIVLNNNGTLDKYIGDAIMAFYNAPIDVKNHERYAITTALEMVEELKNVNEELTKRKLPTIDFGAGINTGDAIVGNIGSLNRFDYSVIGDSVNVASRVEGLCKTYKSHIIITQYTKDGLKEGEFLIRELDQVQVRGKKKSLKLYQVMIDTPQNRDLKKLYDKGLSYFYEGKISQAREILNLCYEKHGDETSKIIIKKRIDK